MVSNKQKKIFNKIVNCNANFIAILLQFSSTKIKKNYKKIQCCAEIVSIKLVN